MYQYQNQNDTIAAISTPLGQGGIGMVRVSGPLALKIAEKVFRPRRKTKPVDYSTHTVHYGWIVDGVDIVDEVLLTVMRSPHSYTTEDIIEINCHGSNAALKNILQICVDAGARLAEPGEFTKRAFIYGRIDLTQAEAVLDVIQSETNAFLKLSTHQLKGDLSKELDVIRDGILNAYIEIEAILNFPEDEIDKQTRINLSRHLQENKNKVSQLLDTRDQGRIYKQGISLVFCGKPNVGKSSLLNVFLREPRAIVSDIAGTTRDTIEEIAQINGIPFKLVDTAGILEPRDMIEEEAVARSHRFIQSADVVLLVLDAVSGIEPQDKLLVEHIDHQNVIVIVNKSDAAHKISIEEIQGLLPCTTIQMVSAKTKEGIEDLKKAIISSSTQNKMDAGHSIVISNLRHIKALTSALNHLNDAQKLLVCNEPLECVSDELKRAVNFLDQITGRNIDEDMLEDIFSQFCIGK